MLTDVVVQKITAKRIDECVGVLGPYFQYADGTWSVRNPQTGIHHDVSPTTCRGLRSYMHLALARRYRKPFYMFEGRSHDARH